LRLQALLQSNRMHQRQQTLLTLMHPITLQQSLQSQETAEL